MVRQTKTRKSDNFVIGKGKVTPFQVAFIVDRYLADNNFPKTRSIFRSEAACLLSKSSANEAPRSLMSLSALLDDYICLKERVVIVDQTQHQLEQEKSRVFALVQGVQDLMNTFNAAAYPNCAVPLLDPSSNNSIVPCVDFEHVVFSPSEHAALNTPLLTSASALDHGKSKNPADFSTPASNSVDPRKRKCYKAVPDTFEPTKKSCGSMYNNQSNSQGPSAGQTQDHAACYHQDNVKQSIVAKNLFNRPPSQSANSNSSCPKTPQRSVSSQSEKSISPPEEISSTGKSIKHEALLDTTPSNCTVISSKTIILNSPAKCYSLERKHFTFSSPSKGNLKIHSKRDHVKGRLDFDATDTLMKLENASVDACTTSESDKDVGIFDIDLDALGGDFSISDLLHDFAIGCGGVDPHPPCHQALGASTSPPTGSLGQPNEGDFHVSQDLIEQDQKTKGSDSISSMKPITQCIQISSPAKKEGCSDDQDNTSPGNSTDS